MGYSIGAWRKSLSSTEDGDLPYEVLEKNQESLGPYV